MRTEFQNHLNAEFPFLHGKKLLLAVSGGVDSMVMAELFRMEGFDIALAHCNFQLRGSDSDADEAFVKAYAQLHHSPVFTKKFETAAYSEQKGISVQMAARELRYAWFEKIRKSGGYHFILTAHHADDNIETLLINLIRGTGLEGLTGIPARQKHIIRPLLPFSREHLRKFAKSQNIAWREDSSNAETKYMRNKIRHELLPMISSLNPNYREGFQKTIKNVQGSAEIVRQKIKKAVCEVFKRIDRDTWQLDITKIKKMRPVKPVLYEMLKDFGFTGWDDVYHLLDAQTGKQVFSADYRLLKDRDKLILTKRNPPEVPFTGVAITDFEQITGFPGGKLEFKTLKKGFLPEKPKAPLQIWVDKAKLKKPVFVRKWQEGDYFYPFGMQGKKKLSKFLKDEKISRYDKENIYLLCSKDKIVWVIGKRADDRFKPDADTEEILEINYLKTNR